MAWNPFVQATSGSDSLGGGTGSTSPFSSANTAGNGIIVLVNGDVADPAINSVTDTQGNTYIKLAAKNRLNTALGDLEAWVAYNIAGGSSNVVTAHVNTPVTLNIIAQEFNGLWQASAFDKVKTANGNSSSPSSGATTTATSQDAELVVAMMATSFNDFISAGSGYSNLTTVNIATNGLNCGMASKLVNGKATQTATFTQSNPDDWACLVVTFKLAPVRIQGGSWAGNSIPFTTGNLAAATTTGNCIVAKVSVNSGTSNAVTSVTDSASNTYVRAFSITGTGQDTEFWYAKNITGGASFHLTGNSSSGTIMDIAFEEWANLSLTSPLDSSVSVGSAGSGTSLSSGTSGATQNQVEAIFGIGSNTSTQSMTVGSGYSNLNGGSGVFSLVAAMESKVVNTTGTQSAAFTLGGSANWACGVVAMSTMDVLSIRTQTAVARIVGKTLKTQPAISRVQVATLKTQPAKGNLTLTQNWAKTDYFLDPSADSTPLTWTTSTGTSHFALIDEATRQPSTPNTADYVQKGGAPGATGSDTYLMGTGAYTLSPRKITSVTLWAYGIVTSTATCTGSLFLGGSFQTAVNFGFTTSNSWKSISFSGSWTQADINALKAQINLNAGGSGGSVTVFALYAAFTDYGTVQQAVSKILGTSIRAQSAISKIVLTPARTQLAKAMLSVTQIATNGLFLTPTLDNHNHFGWFSLTTSTNAFTVGSGAYRYLLVKVKVASTNSVSGVTYAGVAMTLLKTLTANSSIIQIWGLANPTTGSNNIVVTAANAGNFDAVHASSYTNVRQINVLNTSGQGFSASETNDTITLTTTNPALLVDFAHTSVGTVTANSGQNLLDQASLGPSSDNASSSYKVVAASGSPTIGYAFTSLSCEHIAVALVAQPVSSTTGKANIIVVTQTKTQSAISRIQQTVQAIAGTFKTPVFDAKSTVFLTTGSPSATWSHTVSGSNRFLLVFTYLQSTTESCSGVTYAGVPMTLLRRYVGTSNTLEAWGLISPATGTNSIVATSADASFPNFSDAYAASFTNVNQVAYPGTLDISATQSVNATSVSTTATTNFPDMLVDMAAAFGSSGSPGGGQTSLYNASTGPSVTQALMSYKNAAAAGSQTMSWSGLNSNVIDHLWVGLKAQPDFSILGIARIISQTQRTQTGKSRLTKKQTKTIPAKTRIRVTQLKTQTAISRLRKVVPQTTTGKANVINDSSRPQISKGDIANTTTQDQAAVATIHVPPPVIKTLSAVSNIFGTSTRVQTAVTRIMEASAVDITAVAFITGITQQYQDGVAKIVQTPTQDQTAVARLEVTSPRTTTAKGRISVVNLKTITGVTNISGGTNKNVLGKANIRNTTTRNMAAKGMVKATVPKTQSGLGRINNNAVARTIIGKGNVNNATLKVITALGSVKGSTLKTITGVSNIRGSGTRTITGVSNIFATVLRAFLSRSRIASLSSRDQTGTSRIIGLGQRNQTAKGNIFGTTAKTQIGVSRIQKSSTRTVIGSARIFAVVQRVITAVSSVFVDQSSAPQGKRISLRQRDRRISLKQKSNPVRPRFRR